MSWALCFWPSLFCLTAGQLHPMTLPKLHHERGCQACRNDKLEWHCLLHGPHESLLMYHLNKNRWKTAEKAKLSGLDQLCILIIGGGHIDFNMLRWAKQFILNQRLFDWFQSYTVQPFLADPVSHLFHLYMQWHSHNFLLRRINTRPWVVYSNNPC